VPGIMSLVCNDCRSGHSFDENLWIISPGTEQWPVLSLFAMACCRSPFSLAQGTDHIIILWAEAIGSWSHRDMAGAMPEREAMPIAIFMSLASADINKQSF
jgi:hypothetical protein